MTTQTKKSFAGLLALFGVILLVQGFGSAITEAGWDTSFGVSAVLREAGAPAWVDLVVGAVGCALLAAAARTRGLRNAP
ncbi:hypothetical protein [Streptomyces sp. Je 1-369]|uniref:hypothetical protein n=1 Tax=Streptomyces sp. Je 1-369 TaxID=2966192 RepID=UPI002285CF6B|nr:hypothetical protein [Streptomyces sp. Je 1-369]WAL95318.1 hypothetical protein NOO62_12935 [Streptomyces sp. Je 1-369]